MLSTTVEFESHWMIFDVANQLWSVFPNKFNFVLNCCSGHLITVRGGFHYFFHKLDYEDKSPIYRIHENGTTVNLGISERPFANESEVRNDDFPSFNLAPFYQRFYKKSQFTFW